jgi:hypothetical protein
MQAELADQADATSETVPASTGAAVMDAAVAEQSAWEEARKRLRLYGDLRLRYEATFNQDDKDDRHRLRMRLRLGLDYQMFDDLLLGAGLRTGDPDDPNSPYVTLGDGFRDFDISIDRLFVTYRPAWGDGLWATGGKFVNPIYRNPVYGELVWDADVNPEGGVIGYTMTGDGVLERFDVLVGGYTVFEDESTDDVWLLSTQATARLRVHEDARLDLSLGYDYYGDPNPALVADNRGNAVVAGAYVSDFAIVHPVVAVTFDKWEHPLSIAAEYIYNHRADIDDDTGYALGARLGRTKAKGDWLIYYQWQHVEQDAVFAAFAQDDFLLASNFRGHVFGGHYMLHEQVDLHLWGLVTSRDRTSPGPTTDSDKDQWRLRLDLTLKF